MIKSFLKKIEYLSRINWIKSAYYYIVLGRSCEDKKSIRKASVCMGGGSKIFVGKCNLYTTKDNAILFSHPKASLLLGVHTNVPTPTVLSMFENAKMIVGKHVMINRGTKVVLHKGGTLEMGDNSYINENSCIHCAKHISIGANCAIAWNVTIMDTDIHKIYRDGKWVNEDAEVIIGNNVWIGAHCMVLKGAIIEDNCIIAAHSVVRGHLKANTIYGGNPLKEISRFDYWEI